MRVDAPEGASCGGSEGDRGGGSRRAVLVYLWTQGSDSSIVHEGSQRSLSKIGIS